jgi:hypothetical protein
MLRPLYLQGMSRQYPLDRRLGGPQIESGRGDKGKQPISALVGNWNPVVPTRSLVSILTELPHILFTSEGKKYEASLFVDVLQT